jgi:hypothetical protein
MAKRKPKTTHLADSLHTAERLTEEDRKDLWIAFLEARDAVAEFERSRAKAEQDRERALQLDHAWQQKLGEACAKYGAAGLNPKTGALTRDPPEADKG